MNHRRVRSPLLALFLPLAFASLSLAAEPPAGHPLAGIPLTELARSECREGGRKLVFIRIRQPDTPPRAEAPPVPVPAREPTAAELEREAELEAKAHHSMTFIGAVWPGDAGTPRLTELHLHRAEGEAPRQARVWLPLDLRLLDSVGSLETSDSLYHFSLILSATSFDGPPQPGHASLLAQWARQQPGGPGYIFEGDSDDEAAFADTLRGLELLLAHEALHRPELAQKLAEREALNTAQAREAALNPPPPKDTTIYFWRSERG